MVKVPDTSKMDWEWIDGAIVDYSTAVRNRKDYVLWPGNIAGDIIETLDAETQWEYWANHLGTCGKIAEKYAPITSVLLANAPRMHTLLVKIANGEDATYEAKQLLAAMWEDDCGDFDYGLDMKEIES